MNYDTAQKEAKEFAAEHGFHFHIFNTILYQHRGWKSEDRYATEEEMEMWTKLGGPHARYSWPELWEKSQGDSQSE